MARKRKYEAIVLSVRIPADKERDYPALFKFVRDMKRSVKVYSNMGMALTSFNEETLDGTLSKFSIIEVDGEWFDEEGFGPASEEDLSKISIPDKLKPNLISKPISLSRDDHLIAVMTYSEGSGFSHSQVEKYFKTIFSTDEVFQRFGNVEVDVFKGSSAVDELLRIDTLKKISITVRRPNHIPKGLIREIEEVMAEENAGELTRTISARGKKEYLQPSVHTQAIGHMSAENGSMSVKFQQDGLTRTADTDERTHKEVEQTSDAEATDIGVFQKLKRKLFEAVKRNRENVESLVEE